MVGSRATLTMNVLTILERFADLYTAVEVVQETQTTGEESTDNGEA